MELPSIIDYFAKTYYDVVNNYYSKSISFTITEMNSEVADDIKDEIKYGIISLDKSVLILQNANREVLRVLMIYTISMVDITTQFLKEAELYDDEH